MSYVLDASVALKWFLPEPDSDLAAPFLQRFAEGTEHFVAPEILLAEFAHVLTKHKRGGRIDSATASDIWADFLSLGIELVPVAATAGAAFRECLTAHGSFYDALYVVLARERSCTVLTADDGMANAYGANGLVTKLRVLSS